MNTLHTTALVLAIALISIPAANAARSPAGRAISQTASTAANPMRHSSPGSRGIEGVWDEQITIKNCVSGAVIATAHGFNMFTRGGSLVATNAAPPATQGPTFGNWWFDLPGREYGAAMRFFRFDPATGVFLGWRDVQREIELAGDGQSLVGEIVYQDFDPTGTQVDSGCASEAGTRVLEH